MTSPIEPSSTVVPAAGMGSTAEPSVVVRAHSPPLLAVIAALVWLVPLLLLAVAAWQTWRMQIDESDSELQNVLTILAEQTEQVFRGHTMALEWVDRRTAGWTWDEIERSAELHDFLSGLDRGSAHFDSVFLADRDGCIRMLNRHFPLGGAPKHVGDRDYFVAARDGAADAIVVGRLEPGRWSRGLSFRVARRRSSPDGSFDGVIAVRLSARYFEQFFGKIIGGTKGVIAIARADGVILARNATVPPGVPGQKDEF